MELVDSLTIRPLTVVEEFPSTGITLGCAGLGLESWIFRGSMILSIEMGLVGKLAMRQRA